MPIRTRRRNSAVFSIVLIALLVPIRARAQDVPRVRLVATGGTISNRTGGRLTAEELVQSMPGIERYAKPEFEQFSNLASSELTLDQWLALAKRLNQIFKTEPEHRRPGGHQRHRYARGARLLPRSDRSQRQAGGGRRIDAQPEHARL